MKVTALDPNAGEHSTTDYTVVLDGGKNITVTRWVTRNSSGREYYAEDGVPCESTLTDEEIEEIDELCDEADDKYFALYHERVMPILAEIQQEVFG